MNKASNQEDEGDRLCGAFPICAETPSLLSGGWYTPMGRLLIVVKWLAETS